MLKTKQTNFAPFVAKARLPGMINLEDDIKTIRVHYGHYISSRLKKKEKETDGNWRKIVKKMP